MELRHRSSDGTTHPLFDPVELLERLAALVSRPRVNLVLCYGVLAPRPLGVRAWWRVFSSEKWSCLDGLPMPPQQPSRDRRRARVS